jgi:hypothetical protein
MAVAMQDGMKDVSHVLRPLFASGLVEQWRREYIQGPDNGAMGGVTRGALPRSF